MKIKNSSQFRDPKVLENLVLQATEQYAIVIKDLIFASESTNIIIKIIDDQSKEYGLRICSPNWRTETDIYSESVWLEDLAKTHTVQAPVPFLSKSGQRVIRIIHPENKVKLNAILLSWVPGEVLGQNLNKSNIYKMGQLFSHLHNFSEHYTPDDGGFTKRRMSKIFAREEPVNLLSKETGSLFAEKTYQSILGIHKKSQKAYQHLYAKERAMVIHHDLWHDNITLDHQGVLHPFDFEDTVWGYPIQDIAMAMKDLIDDTEPDQFETLFTAFKQGYTESRPWPEDYENQIDDFMAARCLWVANYLAHFKKKEHCHHFQKTFGKSLDHYLDTGKYRKTKE